MIDISIVIVNFRTSQLTMNCVASVKEVLKDEPIKYEIVIVDNCSQDGSFQKLKEIEHENVKVFETPHNGGFGYGNNFGVSKAMGKYLFFLNSDTILYPSVLCEMYYYMVQNQNTGVISCLMEDGAKSPLVVSHSFETKKSLFIQTIVKPFVPKFIKQYRGRRNHNSFKGQIEECDWVSGAAMLIPKELFLNIDGWNEKFFMYMEDEELCYRIKKHGYKVEIFPKVGLQHLVGKSGGSSFVAYEKYKSTKIYFAMMQHKTSRFINTLIYIQAWNYMKGIEWSQRIATIKRLKELKNE